MIRKLIIMKFESDPVIHFHVEARSTENSRYKKLIIRKFESDPVIYISTLKHVQLKIVDTNSKNTPTKKVS